MQPRLCVKTAGNCIITAIVIGLQITAASHTNQTIEESDSSLSSFRSLRTLRALRPLRAISRWEGMKVNHHLPALYSSGSMKTMLRLIKMPKMEPRVTRFVMSALLQLILIYGSSVVNWVSWTQHRTYFRLYSKWSMGLKEEVVPSFVVPRTLWPWSPLTGLRWVSNTLTSAWNVKNVMFVWPYIGINI